MNTTCNNCKSVIDTDAKFCTKCGIALHKRKLQNKTESLNVIITFYIIFLLYTVLSYFLYTKLEVSLGLEIITESIFAILVLGFSLIDYRGILKLYKLPKINWEICTITILFPIFSAFIVSYTIEYANKFLFEGESNNYYSDYLYLDNSLAWAILFIAILPPIFEELAFRGFLFNQLQKVINEKVTIIATAFIFALVHFSFISLIWIFPFGIILGYIRSKYNTLWYGIIIHFIHNFIVLMLDYYTYNSEIITI